MTGDSAEVGLQEERKCFWPQFMVGQDTTYGRPRHYLGTGMFC